MITEEQYNEAFNALYDYQLGIFNENKSLIEEIGAPRDELHIIIGECSVGKMEVVDKPNGSNHNESHKFFTEVFVDEWLTGTEGDSFEGNIYAKFCENKWLSIPYTIN